MQSGKLRFRVIIQSTTQTQTAEGEANDSWVTNSTLWADIRTITGKEYYTHETNKVQATHRVWLRWTDGITEKMRVKWGTRYLNIVHIGEDAHMKDD